jgi:hypothetical protein
VPIGGASTRAFDPTLFVASSESPEWIKKAADYVCSGTDDHEEILAAKAALDVSGVYGRVQLAGGYFYPAAPISMGLHDLRGIAGFSTYLQFMDGNYGAGYVLQSSAMISDLYVWPILDSGGGTVPSNGIVITRTGHIQNLFFDQDGELNTTGASIRTAGGSLHNVWCIGGTSQAGNAAIRAVGSGKAESARISDVYIDGENQQYYGIDVEGDHWMLDNIKTRRTLDRGVTVAGVAAQIGPFVILDPGDYGVYLEATADDCIVGPGIVRQVDGSAYTDGVHLVSGATDNTVGPVHSDGHSNAEVADNGTGTILVPAPAPVAGDVSPLTTKGDLWGYTTVDARVAVGTAGDRLTPDTGEASGLRWDTPASAELYITTPAETTLAASTPTKAAGTTALETTPAAAGFTMPSNNRLTYGGTETKKFLIIATFSASSASANQLLGFHLAENGTVNAKTTVERHIQSTGEQKPGGIQGLFEMATNDYVEFFISNETAANNATVENLTLVAVEVP